MDFIFSGEIKIKKKLFECTTFSIYLCISFTPQAYIFLETLFMFLSYFHVRSLLSYPSNSRVKSITK